MSFLWRASCRASLPGGALTLRRLLQRGNDRTQKPLRLFLSTPAIHYLAAGGEEGREEEKERGGGGRRACTEDSLYLLVPQPTPSAGAQASDAAAAPSAATDARKNPTRFQAHSHLGCGDEDECVCAYRLPGCARIPNSCITLNAVHTHFLFLHTYTTGIGVGVSAFTDI